MLVLLVCCRARSPDDARDTFKTLKNQHIGDASARLYYEWAVLEHSAGYISKALGIIAKGMRADAQPARWGWTAASRKLVVHASLGSAQSCNSCGTQLCTPAHAHTMPADILFVHAETSCAPVCMPACLLLGAVSCSSCRVNCKVAPLT